MNTLKHRGGSRIALFVAGVMIALFGAVAGGVGTASAHHVDLEASVNCSYIVHWTASSWKPGDLYGENNHIDVSYQVEGAGASILLASGAFAPGSYSFSGSFTFPSGASHVVITSVTVGLWGGTVGPGGPGAYTVYDPNPGECDPPTSPPTLPPTSPPTLPPTSPPTLPPTSPPTLPPTSPPTTVGATTTSEVASELPTTTTQLVSETPTTTTVRSLPPTGSRSGSMQLVALGLLLIGLSLVLTARRRIA